ncbi:uncharacterized protein BT62DRAFT_913494 [Guyanagaster necrorhizus]|uniref:DUF2421 domain-containing protein n=1 Tax=Guyanagaster necrorhizus TaxID=856835 RepID=A0A9P7VEJ2_9AGAR|nr:uncharacterized protein BT62DRAFT_913494 [Guyanagaster necrorhizus MCA 3950]KAG7439468.1 hypothetical protein BT62DRAFT_913494 [Guyanagaster necrorhizus MCA 3950]
MENEGQLGTPSGSHRTSRKSNTPRSYISRDTSPSSRQSFIDSNNPVEVQSPVAEEDYPNFPATHHSDSDDDSGSDEYDSDEEDSTSTITTNRLSSSDTPVPTRKWYTIPTIPLLYRNIFKCALAYVLASLFTYSPHLSGLISDLVTYGSNERRPLPSGHMVATVAVYFNPAKTTGSMIEADIFCIFGLFYAAFVSLTSMSLFWWLELKPGWEWLADTFVILWIGVSMSILAWLKVWMANPQFNTACSMIVILLFIVLIKEGGLQTLLQVSFIVFCGIVISNLVCFFIWPQSATTNLQTNMTKTLDSFSTLLDMLTNTFLLEESPHHPSQEKIQRAVENHQNSFTSLKKNLKEAKSEWQFSGQVKLPASGTGNGRALPVSTKGDQRRKAYEDAVDCLNRLAQHLNGLRSGTRLQYDLIKAGVVKRRRHHSRRNGNGKNQILDGDSAEDDEETAMLKAAAVMFGDLVDDLGPPLKALSSTCTSSLKRLRESVVKSRVRENAATDAIQPHEFLELIDGIERALMRFESTSNHAVMRLYRKSDLSHANAEDTGGLSASRASIISGTGDKENLMLTASDNEHIFLVYFFIFTLQEFSTELISLVDAVERIYALEQQHVNWRGYWHLAYISVKTRLATLVTWSKSESVHGGRKRRRPSFPKVQPHAPNTVLTPARSNLNFIGRMKQGLWAIGTRMTERDAKFAVKTGMATALLSAPAFFDATRPIFLEYYGDWALISFFIVISPTIGATNLLSFNRVLWTLVGAAVAAVTYSLFPEDAVALVIFGAFYSLPCFYVIVSRPVHLSASRFALLTYNLTCLYCYNIRQRDVSVVSVAWHRALAVIAGVLYAAFVARFWWPSEARRELSKALGEFCLNIGWLYTRLVAANSFAPEYREDSDDDDSHAASSEDVALLGSDRTSGRTTLNNSIREFMAMELHLQIKLIELQGLLAQTQHEPRLKGPFPVKLYRGILTSLQTIMDRLHSMRCVTTREECVRQDFIVPVNKERREMVGNIILYFSTLASAFRLKAPLPPYLPPAEKSREQLVDAIRRLEVVRNRDVKGSRQLLFFAYALTMKGVTQELESLGRTLQDAFGVIGQTPEEFETLFMDEEGSRRISYAA